MPEPLSFTPARREAEGVTSAPVRRRHVLFVPGYDPEGESRYRMLFVREMIRYARRFRLTRRDISRSEPLAALPGLRWRIEAATAGWSTSTVYDVLRWDDIVQRDFRRPVPVVIVLLFVGLLSSLFTGVMAKFFLLNWKFGGVILYPAVMTAAAVALSLGLGFGADALLASSLPAPYVARLALTLGAAGLAFCALYPLGERWFVWHLMHDWVFNFQHGMGWRGDYDRRADGFARHLVAVSLAGRQDELLVVGHSSGATLAVDVVGRALELDPDLARRSGALALLTIGSCVPIVALNPAAQAYRRRMASVMTCPDLLWAEYQAPQDWINFAGFNPARDVKLPVLRDDIFNPVIRSARFREIVAEQTYRSIVFRPFRMHFQFLMANDRAGEYDFLMMTTGPLALRERIRLGSGSVRATFGDADTLADP